MVPYSGVKESDFDEPRLSDDPRESDCEFPTDTLLLCVSEMLPE